MKKYLSLFLAICMCFTFVNLPVLTASADLVDITEDFGTYTSSDDFVFEWGVNKTSTTSTPGFSNGSYNMVQTTSIPYLEDGTTRNGVQAPEVYGKLGWETKDQANGTVTKATKLQGKYSVTVDLEYNAVTSLSAYYNITLADFGEGTTVSDKLKNTAVMVRLAKSNITVFNSKSANTNGMSNVTQTKPSDGKVKLKFDIDTVANTVSVTVNGNTDVKSTGSTMYDLDGVNGILIQNMERFDTGSYIKINKVTVCENESASATATHALLDSLPAKLAQDVDNVTENLTLTEATGVTWSSSDTDVISNSGVVTRGEEDKVVVMTATVDLANGGGVYTKEYTMTVKKAEAPVIPDEPDQPVIPDEPDTPVDEDAVYKVVVDYTKLNDIEEVSDISTTLGSYADVKVTKGTGLEIVQTNSLPVVNNATNTNVSPTVHLAFQGVIDEDEENNTQLRISKFGGKLKVDMDVAVKNDSYKEPVNGTTVGTPYYTMFYGFSPSLGNETTVTFAHVNYRVRSANATIMNTTKAADNSMTPSTLRYTSYVDHKFTTYIDTYSKETKVSMDGDISTGNSQLVSYFNGITITGQDRMQVGSYFNLKKVEISLLEENDDYNAVRTKLEGLPATLVENPDAVTENITLPQDADIKWTTSDSEICDEYGNISRWYSDRKVTLTATYGVGHTVMHKDYILNIKAKENVLSTDILSASGTEITDLSASGDRVAGNFEVTDEGVSVTKEVADSQQLKVKYPLFGEVLPYSEATSSSLKATGYSGIYDVSFAITPQISGDTPIMVNVDNSHLWAYGVEVGKASIKLVCANGDSFTLLKESTFGKTYEITLRADTANSKVWAFVDGELKTPSMEYVLDDEEYFLSALNVVVPADTAEGDRVVLNNISLKAFAENTIAVKEEMAQAIEGLTVSAITSNPQNVDTIKELRDDVNGFGIQWSSNSSLIDVENGVVYHADEPTEVVLSATMYGNGIYFKKDFYLTVAKADDNVQLLDFYLAGLEDYITSQPAEDLRVGLNLPNSYNGISIEWKSSDESIIKNSGSLSSAAVVTKPTEVTLTANVIFKGSNASKEYKYTVSPYAGEVEIYNGAYAPESFTVNGKENVKLTGNIAIDISLSQNGGDGTVYALDSKGGTVFKIVVKNNSFYVVYGNGSTEKYPMPSGVAKNIRAVVMTDTSKLALWCDGQLADDWLDTFEGISDLAGFATSGNGINVEAVRASTDLYGMLSINLNNIDYLAPFAKGVVKEDVSLVTDTVFPCNVLWSSADTSLVEDDGRVNVPDMHKFTQMTLTLCDKALTQVKAEVPVTFAVGCDKAKNLLAGAKVSCTVMEKPGHPASYGTDNDVNTMFGISNALKSPVITLDMGEVQFINTVFLSENTQQNGNGIKAYTLKCSLDGTEWTALKKGTITKPQDRLVAFENTTARYLQLEINEAYSKDVYFNEIEAYLFGTTDDLIALELETIDLGIESTVSSDISLPEKGVFGTALKWSSSAPEIIDEKGNVTRPEKGTTVKLTVTVVFEGKQFTRDFAVYVNGKGSSGGSSGGGGGSAGGGGGTGTSAVPGFAVTDVPEVKEEAVTPQTSAFKDMDKNHWAYENVVKLKELGIVNGDEKGNFNPSQKVTREQFLKMLVEALEIDTAYSETSFGDVDANSWYAPYVAVGTKAGIINGITAETFGIGCDISRQDMAVMLLRVLNMKNVEITAVEGEFADNSSISDYASEAVYAVRSAGIINGYADNTFAPASSLTRAEASAVIIRLLDLLK